VITRNLLPFPTYYKELSGLDESRFEVKKKQAAVVKERVDELEAQLAVMAQGSPASFPTEELWSLLYMCLVITR
jgi:hypothetical protein